ncbi:hypothetical protein CEXT_724951 [Caerostris extrusa]|uniref:Uncharacterized protein n=1 Tax=Caerostris extrusa TaxID=172846 RepID=A0AAV4XQ96_CAEEX|nr:hypothetical protein CEXT_724951 [Caerostris extrusa]
MTRSAKVRTAASPWKVPRSSNFPVTPYPPSEEGSSLRVFKRNKLEMLQWLASVKFRLGDSRGPMKINTTNPQVRNSSRRNDGRKVLKAIASYIYIPQRPGEQRAVNLIQNAKVHPSMG